MSYCRWSCDCYRSDLYVYESRAGWESHVAGRRVNVNPPADITGTVQSTEEWVKRWQGVSDWYESLKDASGEIPDELWLDLSTIGPEADESFIDPTPGDCAARLQGLSAKGFNVPPYAIEQLLEEAAGRGGTSDG